MCETRFKLALVIVLGIYMSHTIKASSLGELYQKALKKSELVAQQSHVLEGIQAGVSEAYSVLLPVLNISAQYSRQPAISGFANGIFPESQTIIKAQVNQPIFKGFRDFNTLNQRQLTVLEKEFSLKSAKLELAKQVASAFYTLASVRADLALINDIVAINEVRLGELKKMRKTGRLRSSSIFELESTLAIQKADRSNIQLQIKLAEKVVTFLTGESPKTLSINSGFPSLPSQNWTALAIKTPSVLSASYEAHVAKIATDIAIGAYFPSIDIAGNYYAVRDVGILKDSHWDATIIATLPIYVGGTIEAQIKQAQANQAVKELGLALAKRKAVDDIQNAILTFTNTVTQWQFLEVASVAAQANEAAKYKEFKQGLITLSDVLIAQSARLQTDRTTQKARFSVWLNRAIVNITAGLLFKENE